jgi:hypothetical protein
MVLPRPANIILYDYLLSNVISLLLRSVKLLDDAYRTEKNVDVLERLLVTRVLADNEQAARVAENEFYRSRSCAYNWLKRFTDSGLKNVHRTVDVLKYQKRSYQR